MEEQTKKHKQKVIHFKANGMDVEAIEKEVLLEHFDSKELICTEELKLIHSEIKKVTGNNHKNFILIGNFNPYLKHYNFYYGKLDTDELYELTKDNTYRFNRIEKEDQLYDNVLNFLVDKIPPEFTEFSTVLPNLKFKYNFNFNCFEIIND